MSKMISGTVNKFKEFPYRDTGRGAGKNTLVTLDSGAEFKVLFNNKLNISVGDTLTAQVEDNEYNGKVSQQCKEDNIKIEGHDPQAAKTAQASPSKPSNNSLEIRNGRAINCAVQLLTCGQTDPLDLSDSLTEDNIYSLAAMVIRVEKRLADL